MKRRLGHARVAYNKLDKIWKSSQLGLSTIMRIFKSNFIAVLLYGCETLKMSKGDEKILDTFLHKCLRRLYKIYWPVKVSNDEIRSRTGIEQMSVLVRRRRWK